LVIRSTHRPTACEKWRRAFDFGCIVRLNDRPNFDGDEQEVDGFGNHELDGRRVASLHRRLGLTLSIFSITAWWDTWVRTTGHPATRWQPVYAAVVCELERLAFPTAHQAD